MSGLAALGGLGHGIMQGAQFQQQKKMQDQQMSQNDARLGMLQEEHAGRQADRKHTNDERQRKSSIDKIMQETMLAYQEETGRTDLSPLDLGLVKGRAAAFAAKEGVMTVEELTQMTQTRQQLEQSGLAELYRQSRVSGDWAGMGSALQQKYGFSGQMDVQQVRDPSGAVDTMFSFQKPDGSTTQLSQSDLESLIGVDWAAAAEERALSRRKTEAQITKDDRQGRASMLSAQGSNAANRSLAQLRDLEAAGLDAVPVEERARLGQRGATEHLTSGAKEQEMYGRMAPPQQQAYRARRVEEITNELLRSNNTTYLGRDGRAKARADAEEQVDVMLGGTRDEDDGGGGGGGQFEAGQTYTDANGNSAQYNEDGSWTPL